MPGIAASTRPGETSATRPHTALLDARARDLAAAALHGTLSEAECRARICEALYQANIHEEVAAQQLDLPPHLRGELAHGLLYLLTRKVIDTDSGGYNLHTGEQSSLCGWARQLARAAVASEMRRLRRAETRNGIPTPPEDLPGLAGAAPGREHATVTAGMEETVDAYVGAVKGRRDTDRILVAAAALREVFAVPSAVRPRHRADRILVAATLAAAPRIARESLQQFTDRIHRDTPSTGHQHDDRMLALWDDQTRDSALLLLSLDPSVPYVLAMAAVSDPPRPAQKKVNRLKAQLRAHTPDRTWRPVVDELVDAYINARYEAASAYAAGARRADPAPARALPLVLAAAAAHPGSPLGSTPAGVYKAMRSAATAVLDPAGRPTRPRRPNLDTLRRRTAGAR